MTLDFISRHQGSLLHRKLVGLQPIMSQMKEAGFRPENANTTERRRGEAAPLNSAVELVCELQSKFTEFSCAMTAVGTSYKNIRNNDMHCCECGHLRVSQGVVADVAKANVRFL